MSKSALTVVMLLAPAMAHAADEKAVSLFNGTGLEGWKIKGDKQRSRWVVGRATLDVQVPTRFDVRPGADGGPAPLVMINPATSVDLYSEKKFGDCTIEVEFMIPKGANSGIYVMGEYELQIIDSFGKKKVGPGDMGGLWGVAAPRLNASKPPGEWQKFVIDFQAPRFKDGKKVQNAKFVKVTLNGEVIHEEVEVKRPTSTAGGGLTGKEAETGPVMIQGAYGPVAIRSVKVTPNAAK